MDLSSICAFFPFVVGETGTALIVGAVVGLLVGGVSLAIASRAPSGVDMDPATLDSFKVTASEEGLAVPLVFGTVRVAGNILYYDNLTTVKVEEGGEGSFGSSPDITTGYNYYLDVWQGICQGPGVTIDDVYRDDKKLDAVSDLGTYDFNPGDGAYSPTVTDKPYMSAMNPIAHIFMEQWHIGFNVTRVPTLHFVVTRDADTGLTNENLVNGVNPAALIYTILTDAGASFSDFDFDSFDTASQEWYDRGYGLNMSFTRVQRARDMVEKVFNYVDGSLYLNQDDEFVLKAWSDSDTYVDEMDETHFIRFAFRRRSYHKDCYSDFKGTYTDSTQDYTDRVVRVRNPQIRALLGAEKQKTIDLTAFTDADTASKRLWEIMKKWSYPWAEIECTTTLEFFNVNPGDVVRISHSDYDLSDAEFRVLSKDISDISKNQVGFTMQQRLEGLFDDNYVTSGGSGADIPDYTPVASDYVDLFELPYNSVTLEAPAYLMLVSLQPNDNGKYLRGGWRPLISPTGSEYTAIDGNWSRWSVRGILRETYPSTTNMIDDDTGILVEFLSDQYISPTFLEDYDRTDLFMKARCIIVDDEIIVYQTVDAEGDYWRLKGCIRGALNTPIQTHVSGRTAWVANIRDDNILTGVTLATFWVKMEALSVLGFWAGVFSVPIQVTYAGKAITPWMPTRIKAERVSNLVDVRCWSTSQAYRGAGWYSGTVEYDSWPPDFDGTLIWWTSYDSTENSTSDGDWQIDHSGAFTLYVKHVRNGRSSSTASLSVGAADGTYIGP